MSSVGINLIAQIALACLYMLISGTGAQAAVLSVYGTELEVQYQMEYKSLIPVNNDLFDDELEEAAEESAQKHVSHLFGYLKSRALVEEFAPYYNFNGELIDIEGIGSPRLPWRITIKNIRAGEDYYYIEYRANGRVLTHGNAADRWLSQAEPVQLQLLKDLPAVYHDYPQWKHCTDSYYQEAGDFWYYYDPFRQGCEALSTTLAESVTLQIEETSSSQATQNRRAPIEEIQGDNQNGDVMTIYLITGLAEEYHDTADRIKTFKDEGYDNFQVVRESLLNPDELGFEWVNEPQLKYYLGEERFNSLDFQLKVKHESQKTKYKVISTYYALIAGQHVVVRHVLLDTGYSEDRADFAKIWKEAMEQGDFIYYGGHSGLGGNLDVFGLNYTLMKKAVNNSDIDDKDFILDQFLLDGQPEDGLQDTVIRFNREKRQILYVDSCSSYSYYLEPYRKAKDRRSYTHIVSTALSSLYESAPAVTFSFVERAIDFEQENPLWLDWLGEFESASEGETYLLSVGGL